MSRDKGCPACCECGESLATSVYVVIAGQLRKSCTLCSRLAGEHVYHLIAEFGWHCPSRDDGAPYPQSECLASWGPRIEAAGVLTTAPDLSERLAGFQVVGLRCPALAAQGERPRLPHDPAIAEYLDPLRQDASDEFAADGPRDPRPASPRRELRRGSVQCELVALGFNPARAPRAYDQADRYEVGDRIAHASFGVCLVLDAQRNSIAVVTQTGPKILAHGRVIEVRADLIELVRDYGEPLTVDEVASYCAIEIDDALRQLNALIRAGVVVRAGVCRYTYAQESRAA